MIPDSPRPTSPSPGAEHPAPLPAAAAGGFWPLFATQMLGALNDNLFKNALVILVLFRGSGRAWLVPLAGAVFILPYALFSAQAGQLADRTPKHRLIRLLKRAEIGLMILAAIGLLTRSEPFLLVVLCGLGVQAAFFGPLKYAILLELVPREQLGAGNGLIEASTFIGILIGTILGGQLVLLPHGPAAAAAAALAVAVLGWATARLIPPLHAAAPALVISRVPGAGTARLIGQARGVPAVWRCILALSWFWALGAAFLAEFPVIVKSGLGGSGSLANFFLIVFSVGVGAGALLAGRLLRGQPSLRLVVPAALMLSLFALDFAWISHRIAPADGLATLPAMLRHPAGWRLTLDLFMVATAGGLFSVPLYAVMLIRADPAWRARMVAANNIVNALAMVGGAVVLELGTLAGLSASALLGAFALANLAVAAWLAAPTGVPGYRSSTPRS